MKKIAIIGNFGKNNNATNGQTIKTKIIVDMLCKLFGKPEINTYDTSDGVITFLKMPIIIFSSLVKQKNIVILPGRRGILIEVPLLTIMNILFNRKLHYVVVGGWLCDIINKYPSLIFFLNRINYIYVETKSIKQGLEKLIRSNIVVMPNCKKLKILPINDLIYNSIEPLKICTFSRISKEKGIEDAVKAVQQINNNLGKKVYSLDIYGQIDTDQRKWFLDMQEKFPSYIKYMGVVPFEKSVDIIKKYFALLFPTYYCGEGFAGTIIDSLSSGVPIVASDWKYNSEIVNDKVGICFKAHNINDLSKKLLYIYYHNDEWNDKKINCLKEASKYDVSNVIHILADNIL